MTSSTSSSTPSSEILALVERFETLNPAERTTLLDWTRTVELHYGAWQPFKRLYKILDTRALDAKRELSPADVQLLAALVARLDTAPLSVAVPRLQPIELPSQSFDVKTVQSQDLTFEVGGRSSYDWSGWRLTIKQRTAALSWQERFALARQALNWPVKGQQVKANASEAKAGETLAAWDFDSRNYIGRLENIELKGDVMTIKGMYASRGDSYDVDISDPTFPHLVNANPSPATWQYMKRRIRRLLRELAHQQSARYWALLVELMHETTRVRPDGALDPNRQWALLWALHGNGARWTQKLAGRGAYRLAKDALLWQRTRREENAPEIWDAHLEEMSALANDENLPLQANLIALQVLAAHKQARPTLSFGQALRFLNGDLPLLQVLALRSIGARWLEGATLDGALAAATILQAGTGLRRQLQPLLESQLQSADAAWRASFMAQALQMLKLDPAHRRARLAANYLARYGREAISDDDLFAHLNLWLAVDEATTNWVLERMREIGAAGNSKRLDEIVALPEEQRRLVLTAFFARAGEAKPSKAEAWEQISGGNSARNEVGWNYLASTAISGKVLRQLWLQLLNGWNGEEIFAPAFACPAATDLFLRTPWQPNDVADWFKNYYSAWSKMQPLLSVEFARAVMSFVPEAEVAGHIFEGLPKFKAEVAPQIAAAFFDRARDFAPTSEQLYSSILSGGTRWPYTTPTPAALAATWRFLEASAVTDVVLQEVWQQLFAPEVVGENMAPAIALLRRANLSAEQIGKWLQTPDLAATFAPNFFGALFSLSAGSDKVALAIGATPEQWRAARPLLLQVLADDALRVNFWEGIWERLRGENSADLQQRLLGDREIRESFLLLANATVAEMMATNDDAHAPLLEFWFDAHQGELGRNDVALIAAATCPLPPIRERGLARVRELGLDLPLALRLIESNLPPAIEAAQEWFRATENGSEAETERAIALCDSPQASVRAWGRDFVARRADTLLNAALLKKLSEGGDAQNQAFVAQQLQETGAKFDTSEFDSAVLKSRGRARRAKNAVQNRLAHEVGTTVEATVEAPLNTAALLELARGRVPRDREWALQQLARLAQNGVEIDGVELVARGE